MHRAECRQQEAFRGDHRKVMHMCAFTLLYDVWPHPCWMGCVQKVCAKVSGVVLFPSVGAGQGGGGGVDGNWPAGSANVVCVQQF